MSTVPKIEAAIEKLPPAELRKLIAWIEDYAAAIGGSLEARKVNLVARL
jgi:hypothetical protein